MKERLEKIRKEIKEKELKILDDRNVLRDVIENITALKTSYMAEIMNEENISTGKPKYSNQTKRDAVLMQKMGTPGFMAAENKERELSKQIAIDGINLQDLKLEFRQIEILSRLGTT